MKKIIIALSLFLTCTITSSAITNGFSYQPLSSEVISRISGISHKEKSPLSTADLSYVKVTYYGFDGKDHIGELIVHKNVAQDVVDIFKDLYNAKFPIEKIGLIDEYNADDNLSMNANNSSAYNVRAITGSNKYSKHSYGLAIDINPVQNPYIKGKTIQPLAGKKYTNRKVKQKGMIVKNDVVYKAFTSRGWKWGGDWKTLKDYQHFEKDI